jgi:DNA-binding Lrp family transcriptional regulator
MTSNSTPKQLRWVKQVRVPAAVSSAVTAGPGVLPTPRERLVAALADRPRTVSQLAQAFGLSQPTMLEQVRRALRDGLIGEVEVADEEKRFPVERYYATAVPVVRQPDRELIESACRGLADEVAAALARNWSDVHAAFAMTHLAREGWTFQDLWPYVHEAISRRVLERVEGLGGATVAPPHGLAWVEDVAEPETEPTESEEKTA